VGEKADVVLPLTFDASEETTSLDDIVVDGKSVLDGLNSEADVIYDAAYDMDKPEDTPTLELVSRLTSCGEDVVSATLGLAVRVF
jgi:Mg-chelatase subunit ChlD